MKKARKILLSVALSMIISMSLSHNLNGQTFGFTRSFGGGYGMGNIQSVIYGHDAAFNNTAGLVEYNKSIIGVNGIQRFMVSDLNQLAMIASHRINSTSVIAVNLDFLQYHDLQMQQYSLSYGRTLVPNFNMGLKMKYQRISLAEYGNKGYINTDIHLQYKPLKSLLVGVVVSDLFSFQNDEVGQINPYVEIGIAYLLSDKVNFYGAISQEINFEKSIHLGFSYNVMNNLFLKAGYFTNPGSFTFGIAYNFSNSFRAEMSTAAHNQLGFSPSAQLMYSYGKEK